MASYYSRPQGAHATIFVGSRSSHWGSVVQGIVEDPKATHSYYQRGPITRAKVVVYGRTPDEALEAARKVVAKFTHALPKDANCWAARYVGFDADHKRHSAAFSVGFGITQREQIRREIDALVAAL